MYMVEIWKEMLKNVKYKEAQKAKFRLPAILPIVLFNGVNSWTVAKSFKDMLNEKEMFEEHLVDFKYILVDVNAYSNEELIRIANGISIVVMMDQKIVGKDKAEFEKRLNQIMIMKEKLPAEKLELILEWLQEVFKNRFPQKVQGDVMDIINNLKSKLVGKPPRNGVRYHPKKVE